MCAVPPFDGRDSTLSGLLDRFASWCSVWLVSRLDVSGCCVVFFSGIDSPVGRMPPSAFFAAGEEHGFREGDHGNDPVQQPVENRVPDDGEVDAQESAIVFAFHEETDGELQQTGRAQYQSGIRERE